MLQEPAPSSLPPSSSASSSSSSSSSSSGSIQELKDGVKALKKELSSSDKMQEVKKKLDTVNHFLEQILSDEIHESFPMLGFKNNLIDKLLGACREVKKNDQQDIYLGKAITIFFDKLSYLKYLYKPDDLVGNIEDHKKICKWALETEISSLTKSVGDEDKQKYQVKNRYIDFIFNIAVTFFYTMNKLNYLKCSYSIIYEWCVIEELKTKKQEEAKNIQQEIDQDIKSISSNEYRRLEIIYNALEDTKREASWYEQGFKTKVQEKVAIDTAGWNTFVAKNNERKEDKTHEKVIKKITDTIKSLENEIIAVNLRGESIKAETKEISTVRESSQMESGLTETLLTSRSFSDFKSAQMSGDSGQSLMTSQSFLGKLPGFSPEKPKAQKDQTFLDSQLVKIKANLATKRKFVRPTWQGLYDFFSERILSLNHKYEKWRVSLQIDSLVEFKSSTNIGERCQRYDQEFINIKKIFEDLIKDLKAKSADLNNWRPDDKVMQKQREVAELQKEVQQGFQRVNQYLEQNFTSSSASLHSSSAPMPPSTPDVETPLSPSESSASGGSSSATASDLPTQPPVFPASSALGSGLDERITSVADVFTRTIPIPTHSSSLRSRSSFFSCCTQPEEEKPLNPSAQQSAKSWSWCSIFSCLQSAELTPTRSNPSINASGKQEYSVPDDQYFAF